MNESQPFKKRDPQLKGRLVHPPFIEVGGAPTEAIAATTLIPEHLLDGGEIVILAIKPSLWFVVFRSIRWLAAMVFVIVLAGFVHRKLPEINIILFIQGALLLGATRVGFAVLQWVSRLYVLTNRRILRLTGILNVDLFECPLT